MPDVVDCQMRTFADDCAVYREVSNENDCSLLQNDLQNPFLGKKMAAQPKMSSHVHHHQEKASEMFALSEWYYSVESFRVFRGCELL